MDKKYKDMSYREFIETVLKIKLDEYQIQVLKMFEELKEKEPKSTTPSFYETTYRTPSWTVDETFETQILSGICFCSPPPIDSIDKNKPSEPEMYIHKL